MAYHIVKSTTTCPPRWPANSPRGVRSWFIKPPETPMNNRIIKTTSVATALLLAGVLTGCVSGTKSKSPPTLKAAYKHHFYVGVAINRTIATSKAVQADNVNRNMQQVERDVALVKEQFNQLSPENDLKWEIIQPYEGPNGYNFGPA